MKIEQTLHTGNVAAAFGVLATSADLTVAGGLGTALGAALSINSIIAGKPRLSGDARAIAKDLKQQIEQTHLSDEQQVWLGQLVTLFPPSAADFTAANMNGPALAERLIERIKLAAKDPELKSDVAIDGFRTVMPAVFQAAIDRAIATNDAQSAMLVELMARSDQSGRADILRDEGITEKAIIRLAKRIAEDTDDVGQAWLELQNAMDIAVRVQAEGQTKSNHGTFVDEVLSRVADLARDGDYATASHAIDQALEQAQAEQIRLLDSGVELAILDRDAQRAARLIVQKTDMEAGGHASFGTLLGLQNAFFLEGRDKAKKIISKLAIQIAEISLKRASSRFERGKALSALSVTQMALGQRERNPAQLEAAIASSRGAVEEFGPEEFPEERPYALNNLALALCYLGMRQDESETLLMSIEVAEEVLELVTKKSVPNLWISSKNTIGIVYRALGERARDEKMLADAIEAFDDCLTVIDADTQSEFWAITQLNMGVALQELAFTEANPQRMQRAIDAFIGALEVNVEKEFLAEQAKCHNQLGVSYRGMGQFSGDAAHFHTAQGHLEQASQAFLRQEDLMGHALAQGNLCNLSMELFDHTKDKAHLDSALGYAQTALAVFAEAKATYYVALTETHIATITGLQKTA